MIHDCQICAQEKRRCTFWREEVFVPECPCPQCGGRLERGQMLRGEKGTYVLLEEVGRGASGLVYRAWDVAGLWREVAIKLLSGSGQKEAQAGAWIQHANIIQIHDQGKAEDGRDMILMEFARDSLRKHLEQGAIPPERALDWTMQIVEGLAAMHGKDTPHRDLKPENVMISNGTLKLTDFGMAMDQAAEGEGERRILCGTPGYMAPEQLQGRERGNMCTDIFALGLVVYELWAGRAPRPRLVVKDAEVVARTYLKTPLPRLGEVEAALAHLPPSLVVLWDRQVLVADPAGRLQDAVVLRRDVQALLKEERRRQDERQRQRRQWVMAALGAATGLAVGAGVMMIVREQPVSRAANPAMSAPASDLREADLLAARADMSDPALDLRSIAATTGSVDDKEKKEREKQKEREKKDREKKAMKEKIIKESQNAP